MKSIAGAVGLEGISTFRLSAMRWSLFLAGFVSFAVIAPAACHSFGIAGAVLLPMHFAVLFAAAVMGVRGGVATAAVSPAISLAVSGMPPAHMLAPMTAELIIYAVVAGWLVHRRRLPLLPALALAMIAGRAVALASGAMGFGSEMNFVGHARALFIVGMPGIIAQLIIIPPAVSRISSFLHRTGS